MTQLRHDAGHAREVAPTVLTTSFHIAQLSLGLRTFAEPR